MAGGSAEASAGILWESSTTSGGFLFMCADVGSLTQ